MITVEQFLSQDSIIDLILNKDFEKLYIYAKKELLSLDIGQLTQVLLDSKLLYLDDVSVIEFAMFYKSKIGNIILPDSIQEISLCAFEGSELKDIKFSSNLTYIDDYAFTHCYNLKQVALPDSVTHIGSRCFYRSGLEEIVVSKNIETIRYGAFSSTNLKRIIFRSKSDIDIEDPLTIFDRSSVQVIIPESNTSLERRLRLAGFSHIAYIKEKN